MRIVAPFIADIHANCKVGLTNPASILEDGCTVTLNVAQQWLWSGYEDFVQQTKRLLKRGDKVVGCVAGDGPDENYKDTGRIAIGTEDVLRLAVSALTPLREVCKDGWVMVRGTEVHDGKLGSLTESVAQRLSATKLSAWGDAYSGYMARLNLGGIRVDVTHHGRIGRLPNTLLNAAGNVVAEILSDYFKRGEEPPQVAVQAHNHRFFDTSCNYPVRVVGLPCFQLQTVYGYKVAPRTLPDIGGVWLIVEDGRLEVRKQLYIPERGERCQLPLPNKN